MSLLVTLIASTGLVPRSLCHFEFPVVSLYPEYQYRNRKIMVAASIDNCNYFEGANAMNKQIQCYLGVDWGRQWQRAVISCNLSASTCTMQSIKGAFQATWSRRPLPQ